MNTATDDMGSNRSRLVHELSGPDAQAQVDIWGLVCLQMRVLDQPSAPLLREYQATGCPVKMGDNWTRAQLEATVQHGPHVSALELGTIDQIQIKVRENPKVLQLSTNGRT